MAEINECTTSKIEARSNVSHVLRVSLRVLLLFAIVIFITLCIEHEQDVRHRRNQETIDKCVEQTDDARFCWEKYG